MLRITVFRKDFLNPLSFLLAYQGLARIAQVMLHASSLGRKRKWAELVLSHPGKKGKVQARG